MTPDRDISASSPDLGPPGTPDHPARANDPRDREFPCASCGGKMLYEPGTDSLACAQCGTTRRFEIPPVAIEEIDYESTLARLAASEDHDDEIVVHCESCGADVRMDKNIVSQDCAFCGTPIVAEGHSRKHIRPKSLVPFVVPLKDAQDLFVKWLKGLWFAPSSLKRIAAIESRPFGVYIPHWTFDARAETDYTGMRGDVYYVTQTVTVMVNGKQERRTQQVAKIRWTPASGHVRNHFDDILIAASQSLPESVLDSLGDWALAPGRVRRAKPGWHAQRLGVEHGSASESTPNPAPIGSGLAPYTDEFLSGFRAESYTVALEPAFAEARDRARPAIEATIRSDIGGDQQQITSMRPVFDDITFKHILLPLWISAYRYSGKTYRFAINAQTGRVHGDRPYSAWKIAALVLGIALAIAGIIYLTQMK